MPALARWRRHHGLGVGRLQQTMWPVDVLVDPVSSVVAVEVTVEDVDRVATR
jgi:hypothetical protein